MPRVSGNLSTVTSDPTGVSQIFVRAPRVRTTGGGVVTTESTPVEVSNGGVSFSVLSGPAVLVLVHLTQPTASIPLLIGDRDMTLGDAVRAGATADGEDRTALDELRTRIANQLASTTAQADRAKREADRAWTANFMGNTITVQTEDEAQKLRGLRKGDFVFVLDTGNVYKEV